MSLTIPGCSVTAPGVDVTGTSTALATAAVVAPPPAPAVFMAGTANVGVDGLDLPLCPSPVAHLPTARTLAVTVSASPGSANGTSPLPANRHDMFQAFQNWACQNYGDSGKTKTVTQKKYERIVRILSGIEHATSENSKFRFWVKAKGFRLGPPPPDDTGAEDQVLYVPTRVPSAVNGDEEKTYKRVAVVENFFEIIYNVHVEMDGRGGKHAGQKRTYRAIAETYAFLPREAVTRFLMSCADCQKRMHLSLETNNNQPGPDAGVVSCGAAAAAAAAQDPPIIDFSVPITTTYLNHLRSKRATTPPTVPGTPGASVFLDDNYFNNTLDREDSMSSADSEVSREHSPSPPAHSTVSPRPLDIKQDSTAAVALQSSRTSTPTSLRSSLTVKVKAEVDVVMAERNGTVSSDDQPVNMSAVTKTEDRGHPERKRRASDESLDSSTRASESGIGDDATKEDDDDDDADDEEKLASSEWDPERLKAFNMFVRLFVDENLDRMVPISKQPKDKIQAILDACDRQFPEFHERSRKRIRTYLKSCRRMRRSKEQNGWESLRPTPPHLTSAAAEGILAQACENESNNAKRMRMGLEPLPAAIINATPLPPNQNSQPSPGQPSPGQQSAQQNSSSRSASSTPTPTPTSAPSTVQPPQLERQQTPSSLPGSTDYIRQSPVSAAFRPPHELPSPFFTNSNGIFRPSLQSSYSSPPAHHHPPVIPHSHVVSGAVQNGESCPTDLSMKSKTPVAGSKNQLNPAEVATIKQLIAGYRESAAFLYRSADELEQLLLQQN